MKRALAATAVGVLIAAGAAAWALNKPPREIPHRLQTALERWLMSNPGYRLAQDYDCGCDADLVQQRTGWSGAVKPDPDYHPFSADGDGREDLAVGVRRAGEATAYRVLILSGRPEVRPYLSDPFEPRYVLIADRAPSKRTRLLIGPFETEVGGAFEPVTRGGYRYAPNNCC